MKKKTMVCVVDDEELIRHTLCAQLEKAGFATVQAANGAEGLKAVERTRAAIAIVDIVMPEHQGLIMISELRMLFPGTRILATADRKASGNKDYLKLAHDMGANDALAKPFGEKDLIARVKRLTARRLGTG